MSSCSSPISFRHTHKVIQTLSQSLHSVYNTEEEQYVYLSRLRAFQSLAEQRSVPFPCPLIHLHTLYSCISSLSPASSCCCSDGGIVGAAAVAARAYTRGHVAAVAVDVVAHQRTSCNNS